MLLVLGGLRVGDTFHIIPFLKQASKKYRIHWVHGEYASGAVTFIQNHIVGMDITSESRPEIRKLPLGLPEVKEFALANLSSIDASAYDVIVPSLETIDVWFPELVCPNMVNTKFTIAGVTFDRKVDSIVTLKDPPNEQDHIVIQPATISAWKYSMALKALNLNIFGDRKIYNVGAPGEPVLNGSIMENGCSWSRVAELLVSARFAIAVHSSVACLAYYLGVPLICTAFTRNLFPFHVGRTNNTDLITPSLGQLEQVVRSYIKDKRAHIKE